MKKLFLFSLALIAASGINAQQCADYAQFKDGASWTMTTYNAKDKISSTIDSKVSKVTKTGTKMSATIDQVTKNEKGKEEMKATTDVSCQGDKFSIDLRNLLMNDDQAKAYKDMDMKFTGTIVEYPSSMKAGDTLPPVSMNMTASQNGMQMASITMVMSNRKVEGKESLTTTAGTFECYKMTKDLEMTIGSVIPIKIKGNCKDWFSYGIGSVRNESYKNDKLRGYTVLTALTK